MTAVSAASGIVAASVELSVMMDIYRLRDPIPSNDVSLGKWKVVWLHAKAYSA